MLVGSGHWSTGSQQSSELARALADRSMRGGGKLKGIGGTEASALPEMVRFRSSERQISGVCQT